jgi:hypothetical protein
MHNYEFGPFGGASHQSSDSEPEGGCHRHSAFSLVAWIILLAVAAAIVLSIAFWVLGVVAGIAAWIVKIAILAAVGAFVWRRITRRSSHDHV